MYILYHRMLKYHTNIYQLENLKSLLFQTFIIQESKYISESIMPTKRSLLDSKIHCLKLKITFLHITGKVSMPFITRCIEILMSYFSFIKLL